MAALIAALTPALFGILQQFIASNPGASDDEVKAELERLVLSDTEAAASFVLLKGAMAAAKARIAAGIAGEE